MVASWMLSLLLVGAGAPLGAADDPGEREFPANADPWRTAVDAQEADCRGSERVATRRLAQHGGASRAGDAGWEERYGRCAFAPRVGTLALMEAEFENELALATHAQLPLSPSFPVIR